MLWRWILSLVVAGAFSFSLVAAVDTAQQVRLQQDLQQRLEIRYQTLTRWRQGHEKLRSKVEQWNRLWETVAQTPLARTEWDRYPVQIQKTCHPGEASNVLQLLSNDVNAGTDFWFVPREIQASPVMQSGEDQNGSTPSLQLQIQGQMLTTAPESGGP